MNVLRKQIYRHCWETVVVLLQLRIPCSYDRTCETHYTSNGEESNLCAFCPLYSFCLFLTKYEKYFAFLHLIIFFFIITFNRFLSSGSGVELSSTDVPVSCEKQRFETLQKPKVTETENVFVF